MNSSVMLESETSVMSSSCFAMRVRSKSKGPLKLLRLTENPAASVSNSVAPLGDCTTGDELSR